MSNVAAAAQSFLPVLPVLEAKYLDLWMTEIYQGIQCGALERENKRANLRSTPMTLSEYQSFKGKGSKP